MGLGQVLAAKQMCKKYLANAKDVFYAFMDLQKAYDTIDIGYTTLYCGYWRFCPVYIDTVSIKPITASYGGWLAAGQCFGPVIVPPVHFGAFFHFGKLTYRLW